jgi:hypothetical protein
MQSGHFHQHRSEHECVTGREICANKITDKAYFISFSIIILHTDVFNKNNKRKMSRPDYIKNSSCEGVSDDVLACFYDNVVYTPFIHIEDEVDLKNISSKKSKRTAALKGPMNEPAKKVSKEPIDPYTLIFEQKLDILRPSIKDVMNIDDPYNYLGTAATFDTKNVYKSFTRYGVIQIVSSRSRPEAFMSEAAQENPQGTYCGEKAQNGKRRVRPGRNGVRCSRDPDFPFSRTLVGQRRLCTNMSSTKNAAKPVPYSFSHRSRTSSRTT